MPLYVYQCAQGHTTEAYRPIAELDNCPACDCGLETKKIITPVMINGAFLGSYRNPGYKCPVTNQWVDTKRERLNIMAKHDLVEYTGRTAPKPEA
jgi:putative FmdB family regulatory protein